MISPRSEAAWEATPGEGRRGKNSIFSIKSRFVRGERMLKKYGRVIRWSYSITAIFFFLLLSSLDTDKDLLS